MTDEIVNLKARRAVATHNNKGLSLDDLVQIVKDDKEVYDEANAYMLIPVVLSEEGFVTGCVAFYGNISKMQAHYVLDVIRQRQLPQ